MPISKSLPALASQTERLVGFEEDDQPRHPLEILFFRQNDSMMEARGNAFGALADLAELVSDENARNEVL
jgi:hypothetical protein